MIAFLSTWREMGWQAALVFLFAFFAIVCMVIVWLYSRFGKDEFGVYLTPKDLDAAYRSRRWAGRKDQWLL